ncbi:hypothetical protein DFP73DRAFT_631040 [Morchella snyderi]|nr:hypothetical protein DFP73DRAFT_631040 [Morchella snyderi]
MAEVIGAVSAIAALVQLTGLVASAAYQYVGSAKNAQSEAKKLWDEVKSLEAVLQKLQASSVRLKSGSYSTLDGRFRLFVARYNGILGEYKYSRWQYHGIFEKEFVDMRRTRQEEELSRTGEKSRKILDGIYPNPTDRRHVEISEKRHKYTGKWFSQHPDFQAWVDNKLSIQMLWGHGIPGAGKTFIASLLIDELESSASAEKYGVAYIYFNFKEQEQQRPTQALSSLIKKLLTQIKEPVVPAEVKKLYEEFILEGKQPPLQYLQQVLYSLSGRFPRVFFVFDDVFVTSRPYPRDIYECLKKARTTKIEISANQEDIKKFIVETSDENSNAKALIQGISESYTTAREVDDALRLLHTITPAQNPLHEMYDRIIENIIQRQHPSRMKLAKRVLSWLVAAKEVPKPKELRMAVAMGPDDQGPPSKGDMPDNTMTPEVCGGLVMIDEITATVRLSHYSIQEYLLQSPFTSQPHLIIVDFFVTYLCFNYHEPDKVMEYRESSSQYYYYHYYSYETDPRISQNFPEPYLSKYFHKHLKACDESSSTEIYLKLLRNKNALAYYQSLTRDLPDSDRVERNWMDRNMFENSETIIRFCRTYSHERMVSPLLEATLLGHLGSVKALLKDDRYCNQSVTDSGMTVLHHASFKGHDSIIEFFLELGVVCAASHAASHGRVQ